MLIYPLPVKLSLQQEVVGASWAASRRGSDAGGCIEIKRSPEGQVERRSRPEEASPGDVFESFMSEKSIKTICSLIPTIYYAQQQLCRSEIDILDDRNK